MFVPSGMQHFKEHPRWWRTNFQTASTSCACKWHGLAFAKMYETLHTAWVKLARKRNYAVACNQVWFKKNVQSPGCTVKNVCRSTIYCSLSRANVLDSRHTYSMRDNDQTKQADGESAGRVSCCSSCIHWTPRLQIFPRMLYDFRVFFLFFVRARYAFDDFSSSSTYSHSTYQVHGTKYPVPKKYEIYKM